MNFNPMAETTRPLNQTEAVQAIHLNVTMSNYTEFSHGQQVLFTFLVAPVSSLYCFPNGPAVASLGPELSKNVTGHQFAEFFMERGVESKGIALKRLYLYKVFSVW